MRPYSDLTRLLEEEGLDALFAEVSEDEVAEHWVLANRRARLARDHGITHFDFSDDDPDAWALWVWYGERWFDDRARVRRMIELLVRKADGYEATLQTVGAGPLENYMTNSAEDLNWIEVCCRDSADFRVATRAALFDQLDRDNAERVERAAAELRTQ